MATNVTAEHPFAAAGGTRTSERKKPTRTKQGRMLSVANPQLLPRWKNHVSSLGVGLHLWHDESMPTTSTPSELRPLLHEKIDQCAPDDLPLLHRVMIELERDRLVAGLNAEFDRDREAGRLARLPEIIREARAALATRRTDSV